jgi:hypothetical protein
LSYQRDQEVSRLFFRRRFTQPPPAAELEDESILAGGKAHHLQREPLNAHRLERQAADAVSAEVRHLLEVFLDELPGPYSDALPPWDDSCQRVVEQWLEVPWLSIRALQACPLTIRDKVLGHVPTRERKKYRQDLPALVVHWIRTDAGRAWKDPLIRELLTTATDSGQKMSVRFTLLLSFVPDLVFAALRLRPGLKATRHRLANERRRWANPRTRLDPDDLRLRDLRRWAPNCTDEELKRLALGAHRPLKGKIEHDIFNDLGLDKSVGIADTKQGRFWNAIALPLIDYLQPHVRARNTTAGKKPVIPDAVFRVTSQLLALRSNGRWEDKPGRLKSRHYRIAL